MRKVCASIEAYRMHMGKGSENKIDKSWMTAWPKSASLYMAFVDMLVFSTSYDDALRGARKQGYDVQETLDNVNPFCDDLSEIKAALAEERKKADAEAVALEVSFTFEIELHKLILLGLAFWDGVLYFLIHVMLFIDFFNFRPR